MSRLTKEQAAILGAYTGITCGPFADVHEYVEKILGRPVMTAEMASERLAEKIKEASRGDFLAICHTEQPA